MRVLIIGAGGHGEVVADTLRAMSRLRPAEICLVGYLDDCRAGQTGLVSGAPVLGPISALRGIPHDAVIVAIGDNTTRAAISKQLAAGPGSAGDGVTFATARHPSAIISENVVVGDGVMISAGVIVNTGSVVGCGVILNTGCTVDHHTVVGDFAHIAPGVHMGGYVSVGARAFVGIGAAVLPGVTIGAGAVVGAGSVVIKDVAPNSTVIGVPATPLARQAHRRTTSSGARLT
jgi:sugar O-acyltransferase (sialic acid O-acetyltransferase NeuD family)